ncbi:MAG: hypothetical protein IKM32_02365 [Clostridia bacterium]|nr:hypothetical protein [Clostridia bacterium]
MKKTLILLFALLLAVSACISVSAKTIEEGETVYDIEQAEQVSFACLTSSSATAFPRGKSDLSCLVDGDAAKSVTAHNQDGIVLVCNDIIKPQYEQNVLDGVSPAMTNQAPEDVPRYSFVLEYGKSVKFDAVYISFFHEINACVATPGDNAVTVEYSKNGSDWTPVGTDGVHYYRTFDLPSYIMNETSHNCMVEERVVPLSKEISAKYVRLTFNFAPVPEDDAWRYYTNVYEWVGFTELAVASYKSGKKPDALGKDDANVANAEIEGDWICKGEDTVYYYSFANDAEEGNVGYVYKEMLASEYEKDGINAESEAWESGYYSVNGNKVTLKATDENDNVVSEREITVEVKEDGMAITDGVSTNEFAVYDGSIENKPESEAESVTESEAESEAESVTESEAESKAESKEESKSESKEESKQTASLAPVEEDESSSLWLIIVIVAVVIAAAVVAVIVLKKKK